METEIAGTKVRQLVKILTIDVMIETYKQIYLKHL